MYVQVVSMHVCVPVYSCIMLAVDGIEPWIVLRSAECSSASHAQHVKHKFVY